MGESEFGDATVAVTGAASGIGRATAEAFGREGAWVLVGDIDEAGGRETVDRIREAGGQGEFFPLDVVDLGRLRGFVDHATARRNRLDVMCNNVGIPMAVDITDLSEDQWARVIDTNLRSMIFGCKFAITQMLEQGGGVIVNTASAMGLVAGAPQEPAYNASKGGVVLLTRALAIDYAQSNIRVNAVCPGAVATPGLVKFAERFPTEAERQAAYDTLNNFNPIGRLITPDEVANTILFLASSRASGITGVALPVDGGFTAR